MCRVFAGRCNAVVTGAATANDLRVVDNYDRSEYGSAVAIFADVRCLDVGRILTNCLRTVMAVDAIRCNQTVIERRR